MHNGVMRLLVIVVTLLAVPRAQATEASDVAAQASAQHVDPADVDSFDDDGHTPAETSDDHSGLPGSTIILSGLGSGF